MVLGAKVSQVRGEVKEKSAARANMERQPQKVFEGVWKQASPLSLTLWGGGVRRRLRSLGRWRVAGDARLSRAALC